MKKQQKKELSNEDIAKLVPEGHKKPVTRRDFLSYGILPFAAYTYLPNPLSLISNLMNFPNAFGVDGCEQNSNSANNNNPSHPFIPFIQVDLAGGAALMANFVPMDQGGQLLPSYNIMGLGRAPAIVRDFGGAPFHRDSGLRAGIRSVLNDRNNVLNRIRCFGVCIQSGDDRTTNLMALNGAIQRLGVQGSSLPHLGTVNSASVGRHMPAISPVSSPLFVSDFNSVVNALGFTGFLNSLNQNQKENLIRLTSKLSESQARRLASSLGSKAKIQELVECAGIKNIDLIRSAANRVDPRSNEQIRNIWNINENTPPNNPSLVQASLVFNTLRKNTGTSTIELGGFDYHGNPRATTDARDRDAGVLLGRIFASAAALQSPVFVVVTSDGSVVSAASDSVSDFTSDRGSAGMMLVFIYEPDRAINLRTFQLGHFERGQLASENSIVGGSTQRAAAAVIANYLALNNRLNLFQERFGTNLLSSSEIDRVIVF